MKITSIVATLALAVLSVGAQAGVCKKGELGGIVASNVKQKDGGYKTMYKGDKTPFNTSANAPKGDLARVAKLKPGQVNCFADDGS